MAMVCHVIVLNIQSKRKIKSKNAREIARGAKNYNIFFSAFFSRLKAFYSFIPLSRESSFIRLSAILVLLLLCCTTMYIANSAPSKTRFCSSSAGPNIHIQAIGIRSASRIRDFTFLRSSLCFPLSNHPFNLLCMRCHIFISMCTFAQHLQMHNVIMEADTERCMQAIVREIYAFSR